MEAGVGILQSNSAMSTPKSIFREKVKSIILDCFSDAEVYPGSNVYSDLGLDELDFVELIMEIERIYKVDISDEMIDRAGRMGFDEMCDALHEHIGAPAPTASDLLKTHARKEPVEPVERVLCAAVLIPGTEDRFVAGFRHNECYETLAMLGHERWSMDFEGEGFLTSKGRFVTRSEAAGIAKAAGQLISPYTPAELRSEDLY